jgi:hypothetical protein
MSFPSANAHSFTRWIQRLTSATTTGFVEALAVGQHNVLSVPGVIDVSGMEFNTYFVADAVSGTGTKEADADDASLTAIAFSDGGPTGDATTVAELFAASSNTTSVAWALNVPRDSAGTSTTDLDADDWINFYQKTTPSSVSGMAAAALACNYIYGKPGSIH